MLVNRGLKGSPVLVQDCLSQVSLLSEVADMLPKASTPKAFWWKHLKKCVLHNIDSTLQLSIGPIHSFHSRDWHGGRENCSTSVSFFNSVSSLEYLDHLSNE